MRLCAQHVAVLMAVQRYCVAPKTTASLESFRPIGTDEHAGMQENKCFPQAPACQEIARGLRKMPFCPTHASGSLSEQLFL